MALQNEHVKNVLLEQCTIMDKNMYQKIMSFMFVKQKNTNKNSLLDFILF